MAPYNKNWHRQQPRADVLSGAVQGQQLDLDDVLHQSTAGPITAHDVIYGLQSEIVASGQDFYAHKTGFTSKSLPKFLMEGGFHTIFLRINESLASHALAFKAEPTHEQISLSDSAWPLIKR